MIVAHKADDGRLQSLEEHALQSAELAKQFAAGFGCGKLGETAALFHDAGKQLPGFQRRILENGPKVEHAGLGAKWLYDSRHLCGLLLAYCISGHHTGLPDYGSSADTPDDASLMGKLKRAQAFTDDSLRFLPEMDINACFPASLPIKPLGGKYGGFSAAFLIRMLYSCLVDADFLDTERFMRGYAVRRDMGNLTERITNRFFAHLSGRFSAPVREIDKKRCEIRDACIAKASAQKGLFTLTVPTGGGKTLSSLAFAMRHAQDKGMKRIIYAIPYTSIIEQTADVFRSALGADMVLEHHSSVQYDDEAEEMSLPRLASENWAAPVIVTTNVQFFESLFSNRSSACRKLHNMAESVIIFDEAQMLPVPYLLPCLWAVAELIKNYGCTAVLMSATQPALQDYFPDGIQATEICKNQEELFAFFKRTQLQLAGELSMEQLAADLIAHSQVLCIVNTRKKAKDVYDLLPKDKNSFHLSTLMPPILRKEKLEQIRCRLRHGQACRVISTSLIEAGVDVDFPAVYREEAGLDSAVQAAGRCNREGKNPVDQSIVRIFSLAADKEGKNRLPPALRLPIEVSRIVSETHGDLSSPEAIQAYFSMLYRHRGEGLDKHSIVKRLENCSSANFPFATLAKEFKLIEDHTISVFIPLDPQAEALAKQLRQGIRTRQLMRKSALYQVSVYQQDYEKLLAAGRLEHAKLIKNNTLIEDGDLAILIDRENSFSMDTGLTVPDLGTGLFF